MEMNYLFCLTWPMWHLSFVWGLKNRPLEGYAFCIYFSSQWYLLKMPGCLIAAESFLCKKISFPRVSSYLEMHPVERPSSVKKLKMVSNWSIK